MEYTELGIGHWALRIGALDSGCWAFWHWVGCLNWALVGRAFEARLGARIVVEVHHRIWVHSLSSGLHRTEAQRGDAPSEGLGSGLEFGRGLTLTLALTLPPPLTLTLATFGRAAGAAAASAARAARRRARARTA